MGSCSSRKAVLHATVSLAALIFSGAAVQSAIAGETINYTGQETNTLNSYGDIIPTGLSENTVTVSDPNKLGAGFNAPNAVYGGFGHEYGYGSISISDNNVVISGGNIGGDRSGGIVSGGHGFGYGDGDVFISDNNVVISGGNIRYGVVGGNGIGHKSNDVFIFGNSVVVSGGDLGGNFSVENYSGDVSGGNGTSLDTGSISISDNSVVISGGNIRGNVYGGNGTSLDTGSISISDNSVVISGGNIRGNVYGGYIGRSDSGNIRVIKNLVTLKDGTIIDGSIYGGYALDSLSTKITEFNSVVSGNTLNLNAYSGSVAGIYNFENYNWLLPKSVVNNDVVISIKDGGDAVDLSNTKHTVSIENNSKRLHVGDQVVLIDKVSGGTAETPTQVDAELEQGHFIIYDVEMKVDDKDQFVLKIKGDDGISPPDGGGDEGGRINPRAKALMEGRAAALGFLSQASDLIATTGIDNVRMMVRAKDNDQNRIPFLPFLITKGSSNRYDTGSHIDVRGFHMAAGVASGAELEQGHKMTLGAFFEYGRGTYDTYNSFSNYASVKGNGDTHYIGGGIFGRFDFAGTGLGYVADLARTQADGLYLEASLRTGRVSMSFDSSDLIDAEGHRGSYDSKSSYLGGHAAAGYVFNFDEQQSLDVYGRYLWTHMKGDSVTIGKDQLHFDSATSNRMQIGGRYNYAYSDQFKPYIGAAYEYEFSGNLGASAYNLRLHEPSHKGSTGIVEAGFSFMPNAKVPDFSINVTGQGFFGQRRGGSGEIKLKYQF